ncbi:hypothetical protein BE11_45020 [Sorangium cellulosum]|nr:hypothetical protein BE11_45020 [Sorangium cellulosum]
MGRTKKAVILVGHGAPAADCPRELVTRLKALEGRRAASGGGPPSPEEREVEAKVRAWPRTPENDPYRAGIERLAAELAPLLDGAELLVAYNEFCAPTLAEAVATAAARGADEIAVIPSMMTPGGVHAEVEIPEAIARLRAEHPSVALRYAWPFDLPALARLLAAQLARDLG